MAQQIAHSRGSRLRAVASGQPGQEHAADQASGTADSSGRIRLELSLPLVFPKLRIWGRVGMCLVSKESTVFPATKDKGECEH